MFGIVVSLCVQSDSVSGAAFSQYERVVAGLLERTMMPRSISASETRESQPNHKRFGEECRKFHVFIRRAIYDGYV